MTSNRRRDAKRDANELEIVRELELHGCSVVRLVNPLDLLVGLGGITKLVEVKTEKGKLTPSKEKFIPTWRGGFTVLTYINEARILVEIMKIESKLINGDL